jgi:hypothetical protein
MIPGLIDNIFKFFYPKDNDNKNFYYRPRRYLLKTPSIGPAVIYHPTTPESLEEFEIYDSHGIKRKM